MKHHTDDLIRKIDSAIEQLNINKVWLYSSVPDSEKLVDQLTSGLLKLKHDLLAERELTIQKHKDVHGNGDNA